MRAASGGADAGTPAFLRGVGALDRKPCDMERKTPRRHMRDRAFVEEAALDERIGDEALQLLAGPFLHSGGNFLAEEFEQKIGHGRGRNLEKRMG